MALDKESLKSVTGGIELPSINYSKNFTTGIATNIGAVMGDVTGIVSNVISGPATLVSLAQSTFKNIKQSAVSEAGAIVGAVTGSVLGVVASAQSIASTATGLIKKFAKDALAYITEKINYVTEKILKFALQFAVNTAKLYAKKLAARIIKLTGTITLGLVVNNDVTNFITNVKNIQENMANLSDTIIGKTAKVTGRVKEWGDSATNKIKEVSKWICKGEDYIIDAFNSIEEDYQYNCDLWIDEKLEALEKKTNEWAETLSTKWSNAQSDEEITQLAGVLKRRADWIETKLEKIKIKAKTIVRTVIMELLGRIGF